jgi:hypothetical protein
MGKYPFFLFELRSGMRRNIVDYGIFKARQFWQRSSEWD